MPYVRVVGDSNTGLGEYEVPGGLIHWIGDFNEVQVWISKVDR
jgi:hypothetical protein